MVPDIFTFGDHVMIADAGAQGWYRAGTGNASFYLSHRSAISIAFDGDDEVTRGDLWRISGRLYDVDDAAQAGLPGRAVQVYLDGELVTVATTLDDGSGSRPFRSTLTWPVAHTTSRSASKANWLTGPRTRPPSAPCGPTSW